MWEEKEKGREKRTEPENSNEIETRVFQETIERRLNIKGKKKIKRDRRGGRVREREREKKVEDTFQKGRETEK